MSSRKDLSSFSPSWPNRVLNRALRRKNYPWVVVIGLPLAMFILAHAAIFALEASLAWKPLWEVANLVFWQGFSLAGYVYFHRASNTALEDFRPSLEMDDKEFDQIKRHFWTLPSGMGWLPLAAVGFSVVFMSIRAPIPVDPDVRFIVQAIMVGLGSLTFTISFHLMVAVIYALRRINRLYDQVTNINIFNLEDLYALSGLTARIGSIFVVAGSLSYIFNILLPESEPEIEVAIFFVTFNTTLAVLAFLLPLIGIHNKLAKEKQRVARENNRKLQKSLKDLHQRSDHSQLDEMPLLRDQIGALMEFRREINTISTWPWQPETLRGFITAVSLPVVVWLIQQFLALMIGV